jgi:hypothetical protein
LAKDDFFEAFLQALESEKQFLIMTNRVFDFPDISAINQRYADALGKSVDELTEAERKQAFLNAILSKKDVG